MDLAYNGTFRTGAPFEDSIAPIKLLIDSNHMVAQRGKLPSGELDIPPKISVGH